MFAISPLKHEYYISINNINTSILVTSHSNQEMVGDEIFRYLRVLGYPYNCKNRPSKKQYFYYLLLILFCIVDFCGLNNEQSKKILKDVGRIRFAFTVAFIVLYNSSVILCLCSNNRFNHPLNQIVAEIRMAVSSPRLPKSDVSWLHVGFTLITIHAGSKIYSHPFHRFFLESCNGVLKTVIMYCYLSQFIMPLQVLSKRTSQLRDALSSFYSREDRELCQDVWALVSEQIRLERIQVKLIDSYLFYLVLIVFVYLYRASLGLYLFIGVLLDFIPEASFASNNLRTLVVFSHGVLTVQSLFKIWCVGYSTAFANNQVTKPFPNLV